MKKKIFSSLLCSIIMLNSYSVLADEVAVTTSEPVVTTEVVAQTPDVVVAIEEQVVTSVEENGSKSIDLSTTSEPTTSTTTTSDTTTSSTENVTEIVKDDSKPTTVVNSDNYVGTYNYSYTVPKLENIDQISQTTETETTTSTTTTSDTTTSSTENVTEIVKDDSKPTTVVNSDNYVGTYNYSYTVPKLENIDQISQTTETETTTTGQTTSTTEIVKQYDVILETTEEASVGTLTPLGVADESKPVGLLEYLHRLPNTSSKVMKLSVLSGTFVISGLIIGLLYKFSRKIFG